MGRDKEKQRLYNIKYRKSNPDKVKQWNKSYRPKKRDNHRRSVLGVTPEQTKTAMIEQNGLCALCHLPFEDETPAADHNHETKKFRGLLHRLCNLGISYFKDDVLRLQQAIDYLNKTGENK